jgi:hypothetical protein
MMQWRAQTYPVVIDQRLDIKDLATLTETEADEADESGQLAGNHMYQDLRGLGWDDLSRTLDLERQVMARLQDAEDLEDEAARLDDERLDCFEPSDGLWELDIGVASATVALSALGAVPVGSCNAGGFGGQHQGGHPYVAFYLGIAAPETIIALARAADVGLRSDEAGLIQIFATGDFDLFRFAQTVRDRCGRPGSQPPA